MPASRHPQLAVFHCRSNGDRWRHSQRWSNTHPLLAAFATQFAASSDASWRAAVTFAKERPSPFAAGIGGWKLRVVRQVDFLERRLGPTSESPTIWELTKAQSFAFDCEFGITHRSRLEKRHEGFSAHLDAGMELGGVADGHARIPAVIRFIARPSTEHKAAPRGSRRRSGAVSPLLPAPLPWLDHRPRPLPLAVA